MNNVVDLLNALSPYFYLIAIVFLAVYGWLKKYHPDVAKKLEAVDHIAENVVAQEAVLDKTGTGKKEDATKALLGQASKLHIPVTKTVAAGAVEKAYQKTAGSKLESAEPTELESDDEDTAE